MTLKQDNNAHTGGLVIATVCDIRGFTDMTATVDAVNQSLQVTPEVKKELLRCYSELVSTTQKMAVDQLMKPFIECKEELHKTYRNHNKCLVKVMCALKSTGDGFLFALDTTDSEGNPLPHGIQHYIARLVLQGMEALVRSSLLGKLHTDIATFLKRWEPYLALAVARRVMERSPNTELMAERKQEDILWESTYRDYFLLAGAAAIGTGQFTEDLYPHQGLIPDRAQEILDIKADAYGHGVNMAFRICDKAGRDDAGRNGSATPDVLLDRRVGQLLISEDGELERYRMTCFQKLSLSRVEFQKPLRGIDERWCYGLTLTSAEIESQRLGNVRKKHEKTAVKRKKS